MNKNVKIVKLITGEEVLCDLVENNIDSIHIAETLLVGLQQDPQTGKVGPGVMPFCPFAIENIIISKTKIVFIVEPAEAIKNIHQKTFGVVMIPAGIIATR